MEKPFVFGVATSGDNFTDREKETQRLLLNRSGKETIKLIFGATGKNVYVDHFSLVFL